MDTKVNYVVVGLFVVILTFATAISTIWIAGGHHSKQYDTYVTFSNEAVDGITLKSPVKFNGVDVGYIDKILLNPKNPQEVRLEMKIVEGTPINQSTVATIRAQGITGYTYIGLHAKSKTAPALKKGRTELYPVIPYESSLFKQLDMIAQDVSKNINKVSAAFTALLSEETQKSFKHTIENLDEITSTLERNSETIEHSITAADKFLQNTAEASDGFEETMQTLNKVLSHAEQTTSSLSSLADSGRRSLTNGNRALKDFTDQALPSAYQTLEKLRAVMGSVETLTDELNRNPSMLIRGKRSAALGPGE